MAYHHRKLLNESTVDPTSVYQSCDQYCDPARNPFEICPLSCVDLCPPFCKYIPPPPTPSPEAAVVTHPPPKSHRLSLALTASLAVLAAAFFLFTCYTIYRFYSIWRASRRRRRRRSGPPRPEDDFGPDHGPPLVDHHVWYIRTIGLQPSVISSIAIVRFRKGDGLIDGTDCSVCLSEFEEDETLRLLPKCNHAFHVACIDTWLRSHTNCPLCRARIVNPGPGPGPIVRDPGPETGPVEETRDFVSESNGEAGRESDDESSESRIVIAIEDVENGTKESDGELRGLDGVQPLRRSVSLDSLSASMISVAVGNDGNSDDRSFEMKESSTSGVVARKVGFNQGLLRLIGSPLVERSIQTGSSSSMKRSVSCSENVLPGRQSK